MKNKATLLLIALLSLAQLGWTLPTEPNTVVRACAYENAPKIYTDETGTLTGFWPDLLNAIAQKENWTLVWKHGSWGECLAWLEENQVDVVPDMGWTEARSQTYAFSAETVLTSWARLYVPVGSPINSILDLEGKQIAGLKGSFNMDGPEGIKDLVDKFGLHATFVEMESYTQVFEALDQGTVDAGITNKDFGNLNETHYRVVRTSILFQPARIHFAFTKDAAQTPYLIERIDADMQAYKADPNSIYYRALDQYLGASASRTVTQVIPNWLKNLALAGAGLILFLLAVGIVSRIQVRRRTAELEKSRALLQSVIDSSPDAIFVKDTQGKYILCNEGTAQLMGQPIAAILGQDDTTLFPANADHIIAEDRRIMAGGKTITYEENVYTSAGDRRAFLTAKGPLFDNDNIIFGLFGIARDITERNHEQEALRKSEEKFRKAFYTSSDSIIINRMEDGLYVAVNRGFTQITGYTEAEAVGKTSSEIGIWADPNDRVRLAAGLRQNGEVHNLEAKFRNKEGRLIDGLMSAAVIDLEGSPHIISITRDITDRKRAEEEIRQLNAELESRVAQRTAQLEYANKDLESFSYSVSHDLRAPLRAINGFASIIARRHRADLNEQGQHYVDNIVQASERMGQIIDDLLTFSRLGRTGVKREAVDLAELIGEISAELRSFIKENHGILTVAEGLPQVIGDETLLRQIFTDLLENATKYHRPTVPPEIIVDFRIEAQFVVISVADNGIGIAPDYHDKIFVIFQRLHSEDEYPGTGVGLASVKKSVELLNGKVWVESQLEQGSTFFVRLPKGKNPL